MLILQYHLSFPIPNDLAKEMTRITSVFEALSTNEKAADIANQQSFAEWKAEETTAKSSGKGGSNSKSNMRKEKGKKK